MSEIDIRIRGRAGRITLNRPKALNAVTLGQIRAMAEVLPLWAKDDNVALVIIDAVGEKAFSAGGDIADIYAALTKGNFAAARNFWREEYPVNALLGPLSQAHRKFHAGVCHGGRRRCRLPCFTPCCGRHQPDRHAGMLHRVDPGRGRHAPAWRKGRGILVNTWE